MAPGCLGATAYAPAGTLVPLPACVSFEGAATTPTVYCTVYTAFDNCRDLRPGTKVRGLLCSHPHHTQERC